MANSMKERMAGYLAGRVGCAPELLGLAGVHVVPSERLAARKQLLVISTFTGVVVVVPEQRAEAISARLVSLAGRCFVTTFDLINALDGEISTLGPQLFHGFFASGHLRPVRDEHVRKLGEGELVRLAELGAVPGM